jgi:hypothetical protein
MSPNQARLLTVNGEHKSRFMHGQSASYAPQRPFLRGPSNGEVGEGFRTPALTRRGFRYWSEVIVTFIATSTGGARPAPRAAVGRTQEFRG